MTVLPWAASVPAWGFCLTTVLGGAVEFWSVCSLTWNPAYASVFRAFVTEWCLTFGTLTLRRRWTR